MINKLNVSATILVVGIAAFLFAGYEIGAAYKCMQAKNWTRATGEITQSRTSRTYGRRSSGTQLHFDYRYSFQGKTYKGDQVNHGSVEGMSSIYILGKYPRGTQVVVYVNPKYPNDAVLEPEFKTSAAVLFGVSVMTLILACCSPWLLRGVDYQKVRHGRFREPENLNGQEEEEFDYAAYAASLSGK